MFTIKLGDFAIAIGCEVNLCIDQRERDSETGIVHFMNFNTSDSSFHGV